MFVLPFILCALSLSLLFSADTIPDALQEEEYRLRQLLELGPDQAPQQQTELDPLQGHEEEETMTDSSRHEQNDSVGRGGSLGTGYFDAAGNWQTYDLDADMASAEVATADGEAAGEAAGFAAAASAAATRYVVVGKEKKRKHDAVRRFM